MSHRRRIVGTLVAAAVLVPTASAFAGQQTGYRNCSSSYVYTFGNGYGNHVHVVNGVGQQWSHPINSLNSHYYYSNFHSGNWSVTTGGQLLSATANCYGS